MNDFRLIWDILTKYALTHNSFGTKTTASDFETAVKIFITLGLDVRYRIGLYGSIKFLSLSDGNLKLYKEF